MDYIYHYKSPIGDITLSSDGSKITGLWFDGQKNFPEALLTRGEEKKLPIFPEASRWLDIYFSGKAPDFTPPLCPHGTAFQKKVWKILLTIPFGHTMTYGEIAKITAQAYGKEKMSAQAVGGAVGHNPISLIIPCHRIVGADGSLTGYAAGTDKKAQLLKMENANFKV